MKRVINLKYGLASLIILMCVIASFACNSNDNSLSSTKVKDGDKTETISTKVESSAEGKRIYKLHCIICHGAKGNMGASGATDLTESSLSRAEQIEIVTNGKNTMTAYKDVLNEKQIKAVVKYIQTLKN